MSPIAKLSTAPAPTTIWLAVDPASTASAVNATPPDGRASRPVPVPAHSCAAIRPPEPSATFPTRGTRTPPARPAARETAPVTAPNAPARKASVFVPQNLWKLSIHPKSSHGAGGEPARNAPYFPGSKIAGCSRRPVHRSKIRPHPPRHRDHRRPHRPDRASLEIHLRKEKHLQR